MTGNDLVTDLRSISDLPYKTDLMKLEAAKYHFLLMLDIMMWRTNIQSLLDSSLPLWQKHIGRLQKIDKLFGDKPDPAEEQKERLEFVGNFWLYQVTEKADAATKALLSLEEDYEVTNKKDCDAVLNWLLNSGHREAFLSAIQEDAEDLTGSNEAALYEKAFLAWDAARFVNVVKRGRLLGYYNNEELAQWLDELHPRVVQKFKSWSQFFDGFMLGKKTWEENESQNEVMDAEDIQIFAADNQRMYDNVAVLNSHPLSPWIVFDTRTDYAAPAALTTIAAKTDSSTEANRKATGLKKYWWVFIVLSLVVAGLKIGLKQSQRNKQPASAEERLQNLRDKLNQ